MISTAILENFGLAVVEAMRMGCLPLLPRRLSYPEILPQEFHADFLYDTSAELTDKLSDLLINYQAYASIRPHLSAAMQEYAWPQMIQKYDAQLDALPTLVKPIVSF